MTHFKYRTLFSLNVKIYFLIGLLGSSDHYPYRNLLIWCVPILNSMAQIYHIYGTSGILDEMAFNLFVTTAYINGMLRNFITLSKRQKLEKFLLEIDHWCEEIERSGVFSIKLELLRITRSANKISQLGFFFSIIGALFAYIYPICYPQRRLILELTVPIFDCRQTPFYELIYLVQLIFIVPIFILTYLPFTNIFLTSLLFGKCVLKDLSYRLQNLDPHDPSKMLQELKNCIAYHQRIMCFRNDLNSLASLIGLCDVFFCSFNFCIMMFYITLERNVTLIATGAVFFSFLLYIIFISYWYADQFSSQSQKVSDAAYNTPWYNGNLEMRRCLIIMMTRAQRALTFSALGLFPMNLVYFQAIVRISYSYFTMLQGLIQK